MRFAARRGNPSRESYGAGARGDSDKLLGRCASNDLSEVLAEAARSAAVLPGHGARRPQAGDFCVAKKRGTAALAAKGGGRMARRRRSLLAESGSAKAFGGASTNSFDEAWDVVRIVRHAVA